MKYKVLSDQDLRAMRGLLEDGIYDYEVMDAVEKAAREKPDHEMIELTLKIIDKKGNPVALKDWLLGYDEKFVWKRQPCPQSWLCKGWKTTRFGH